MAKWLKISKLIRFWSIRKWGTDLNSLKITTLFRHEFENFDDYSILKRATPITLHTSYFDIDFVFQWIDNFDEHSTYPREGRHDFSPKYNFSTVSFFTQLIKVSRTYFHYNFLECLSLGTLKHILRDRVNIFRSQNLNLGNITFKNRVDKVTI